MALVHEMAEEGEASVSNSEEQLSFLKSGYVLGGYIPTLRYVDLENGLIKEPG